MSAEEVLFPRQGTVGIVDPRLLRLGRLWIHQDHLLITEGMRRVTPPDGRPLSLCLLYQQGRCMAKERCNQAHVRRSYAHGLFNALVDHNQTVCCQFHDANGLEGAFEQPWKHVYISLQGKGLLEVPTTRITRARFWTLLLTARHGSAAKR